ncbi:uncharacterized protein LOC135198522 isoform X1 [Macrobrachium nipponense]|uniref:uncharacterized protein LOC135198522 isoform X1 n=1 Tax=Macrobrachium nipponense TaxID=159736 RepID=UPI0030C8B379
MCSYKGIIISGILVSSFAILASMGTLGFYSWKVYELTNVCDDRDNTTQSDVCKFDELEVRSCIGLAEGIFTTIVAIVLLIGFASPAVALLWIWVVWALGIASYNAYCIKDYHDVILDQHNVTSFPWDTFVNEDYGYFFVVVMTSVMWYGTALLMVIPMAGYLTHMYKHGNAARYTFTHDNEAFSMDTRPAADLQITSTSESFT